MCIKYVLPTLALVAIVGQTATMTANGQTQSNASMFNLGTVTCKDLMLSESEDKRLTISLFHGFFNGRKNETRIDANQLAQVTDEIENYCVDNPKSTLMSAFQKYRGESK